jgi:glycosyltransferase involved in cell wall biosynthesis
MSQFLPVIRAALPNVRIMLHMHAEWLALLDRKMMGRRIPNADSIIFCSNYFAQQTRDAWPEYAHLCHTVYNGVTMSEFDGVQPAAKDAGVKRILFVSRVSPDKGVHVLVDAFNKIVQKYPNAELKIVGPWHMLPKSFCLDHSSEKIMQDLIVFYGSQPFNDQLRQRMSPQAAARSEITGPIPREDLVRMFQSADVLVLPSIYPEGFGIPIAEAGACGVPAIVARRGGMPEVVEDGKTGFIVESANVDALADAIIKMLDDEPLRQRMGQAARQRVQDHFTWERIADSLLAEYDRMLKNPKTENVNHAPVVAH